MPLRTDFYLINGGSIFLLHPITKEAKDWADKHIDPNTQHLGNAIAVEHRFIADIVQGILDDGLEVK